jgi:dUTP pyrophosphatase
MYSDTVKFGVWLDPQYPDAKYPEKKHTSDAGFDISSAIDVDIPAGESKLIKTGVYLEMEEGWECQVRSRSGLAAKNGIFVLNSPGTIDCMYRNEVMVILKNTSNVDFHISAGDRIAQLVFSRVPDYEMITLKDKPSADTSRGLNGFGSTGVK